MSIRISRTHLVGVCDSTKSMRDADNADWFVMFFSSRGVHLPGVVFKIMSKVVTKTVCEYE